MHTVDLKEFRVCSTVQLLKEKMNICNSSSSSSSSSSRHFWFAVDSDVDFACGLLR